jgi:hypothetical protein
MCADLVIALGSHDFTVTTVRETGLTGQSDEEQLAFATRQESVLYTFNVRDFHRIHTQWVRTERERAGMILARQQQYSIGEQLRCLLRLRAAMTAAGMRNKVEFLANWG